MSLYLDRDGDVWAVRDSDGAAVNVVCEGDVADDLTRFIHAYTDKARVETQHGPLRPLVEAPAPKPSAGTALADVLVLIRQGISDEWTNFGCADADSPECHVFEALEGIFDRAAEAAKPRG